MALNGSPAANIHSEIQENPLSSGSGNNELYLQTELFLRGDYTRSADDLVITGVNGNQVRIDDYFLSDTPADISLPNGGKISGNIVESLLSDPFKGALAQANTALAQDAIGEIATIDGSASVQRNGQTLELNVGDAVFQNDVVATALDSTLGIGFVDGTVFTLSADARMVLDELIYEPEGQDNSMAFNLLHGTFVFVAGQVARTGDMEVETPIVTMGIRGTTPLVRILNDILNYEFALIPDPNGLIGAYTITDNQTGELLAVVDEVGVRYRIGPDGQLVVAQNSVTEQTFDDEISELMYAIYNQVQALDIETRSIDNQNPGTDQNGQSGDNNGGTNGNTDGIELEPLDNGNLNDLLEDDENDSGGPIDLEQQGFLEDQGNIVPDGNPQSLIIIAENQTVDENESIDGDVSPIETTYVYSLVEGSQPPLGTLIFNTDGTYSYDTGADYDFLMENQIATVTFQYTVTNTETGEVSEPQTVTINITGIDDPAQIGEIQGAVSGSTEVTTIEDTSIELSLPFSDPDSIFEVTISTESFVSLDPALLSIYQASGLLTFSQGDGSADPVMTLQASGTVLEDLFSSFTYTPSADQTETGSVEFTITEVIGGTPDPTTTQIRTIDIEIDGENDAPTANPDTGDEFTTDANTALDNLNVLGNDTDPDTGDVLTVTEIDTESFDTIGIVTLSDDGILDYDPGEAFLGLLVGETATDTFSYTIQDGAGETSTTTVDITIEGTNFAPQVESEIAADFTTDDTLPQEIDLLGDAGAFDQNEDPLTLSIVNVAIDGIDGFSVEETGLSLFENQFLTFDAENFLFLEPSETQVITITYLVTDQYGASVENTATISVTGNEPPEINGNPDGYEVVAGSILEFDEISDEPISISDPDSEQFAVGITANDGAFVIGDIVPGVTYIPATSGDTELTELFLIGELDAVNSVLAGLSYIPEGVGEGSLSISVFDGADTTVAEFSIAVSEPGPLFLHYDDLTGSVFSSEGLVAQVIDIGEEGDFVQFTSENSAFLDSLGDALLTNDDGSYTVDILEAGILSSSSLAVTFTALLDNGDEEVRVIEYDSESAGVPENLVGSGENDTTTGTDANELISGFTGDDILNGGGGADILIGGEGMDELFGDAGNDFLDGGLDFDRLTGGGDADTFYQSHLEDGVVDIIEDYSSEEGDIIDVSALLEDYFADDIDIPENLVIFDDSDLGTTLFVTTDYGESYQAAFELVGVGSGDVINVIFENGSEPTALSVGGLPVG